MKSLRTLPTLVMAFVTAIAFYSLQLNAQEEPAAEPPAGAPADVVYPGGGPGEVTFSHASHLAQDSIENCASCHPGTFQMAQSGALTMEAMNGGAECGTCHSDSGPAFPSTQCMQCHSN